VSGIVGAIIGAVVGALAIAVLAFFALLPPTIDQETIEHEKMLKRRREEWQRKLRSK